MYDISIIVPIYNVEKYLKTAIESLLGQKKMSYEIILVDDGSKDSCRSICDSYAKIDNVKVIHKENGGLSSARKAGVRVAEGRYIGFLDGDDWVDNDYYFNMLQKANETDADVICSTFVFAYPDKEIEVNNVVDDGFYKGAKLNTLRKKILYTEPYYTYGVDPSLCMKLIKKSYMDKYLMNEPNNITLAEDASCSFPVMFNCESIFVLHSNKGYHYRQLQQSMTRAYDENKMIKVETVLNYFNDVMRDKYDLYHEQIDKFFGFLVKDIITNEIKSGDSLKKIKQRLVYFRNHEIVLRTLTKQKNIPFKYKLLFNLYRCRVVCLMVLLMSVYTKVFQGKKFT